jgi:hypothetical protein
MGRLWAFLAAYLVLILGGVFALTSLARVAPLGWATLSMAVVFPALLVAISGLANRYEARHFPPREPPASILGRPLIGPIRPPFRWTKTTAILILALGPLVSRAFPPGPASPGVMVMVWWVSVAAFTWLVLPRLLARTTFSPSA